MSESYQEKIKRLTRINENPEQFIIEYYDDLKWRVDTYFTNQNEESLNQDWLDYIEYLENRQKSVTEDFNEKPFVSFRLEIAWLKQFENEENLEKIQFKIESTILQSSSILFYTNYCGRTALVLVNDQYIPQRVFDTLSYKHLNKDNIKMYYVEREIRIRTRHKSHLLTNFNVINFQLYLQCIRDFEINEKDIETVDINIFENMPNVDRADFSQNKIKQIPANFFLKYPRIIDFDFSYNQITELPEHLFEKVETEFYDKYIERLIKKSFKFHENLITNVNPMIVKKFKLRLE